MVRNIFKKRTSKDKDDKAAENKDIPLDDAKPGRPSVSDQPAPHQGSYSGGLNVSYEETEIEPEPPQPVFINPGSTPDPQPMFIDAGKNPAFEVERTENVSYHEDEPPVVHPPDESSVPLPQPRGRSWRPHMPHINMPRGIQNLSFRRKKKEQEAEGSHPPAISTMPTAPTQQRYPAYDDDDTAYRAELEATEQFRNRLNNINANRAPGIAWGFDYVNWKPMGYRRRDTHPNEFAHYGRALAPYVATVVESGYVGGQERSSVLAPPPLVTSRPAATSSQAISRDPVMGSIY